LLTGENGTYLDRDENQNLILRFGQCLHPCRDKGECKHPCCKYGIKNNRRKVDESGDVEERPNKRQKTEQGFGAGTNDSGKEFMIKIVDAEQRYDYLILTFSFQS
jgi:hypothetical protein